MTRCDSWTDHYGGGSVVACVLLAPHDGQHVAYGIHGESIRWPNHHAPAVEAIERREDDLVYEGIVRAWLRARDDLAEQHRRNDELQRKCDAWIAKHAEAERKLDLIRNISAVSA